jgi:hypothetical protein
MCRLQCAVAWDPRLAPSDQAYQTFSSARSTGKLSGCASTGLATSRRNARPGRTEASLTAGRGRTRGSWSANLCVAIELDGVVSPKSSAP